MAKTDSFFIRASVATNGTTFNQTSIDLGAYVDALGKSVLRIHRVAVKYGSPLELVVVGANQNEAVGFQLTTQSQTSLVDMTDKSLISSGRLFVSADAGGARSILSDVMDMSPEQFTKGYLVGVEQIYLGTDTTDATAPVSQVDVILECTVETLSQSAAMALALSQQ